MTAALAISIAPQTAQSNAFREHVQVLESRPGVRQVMLVTMAQAQPAKARHALIVLGGGGGGFAVTSSDGRPQVQGGLPLAERQRLANAIGGCVLALSPPTDQPVMDRSWRLSDNHIADLRAAVHWTREQWPLAQTWVLGMESGALSAAVATASIDGLAGAVLLACIDEALEQRQKCDRMRVLAVRHRNECQARNGPFGAENAKRTLVTVHDERAQRYDMNGGEPANAPQFAGKQHQVVDVVARWIVTGTAPDEIR